MKKIIGILLVLVTFLFSADYKPFIFENIQLNDSIQQVEWDILMKYKENDTYKHNKEHKACSASLMETGTFHDVISCKAVSVLNTVDTFVFSAMIHKCSSHILHM